MGHSNTYNNYNETEIYDASVNQNYNRNSEVHYQTSNEQTGALFEEDIINKLSKIGNLLGVIDNSVKVMNQRIETNEEAINSVANYIEQKYYTNPLRNN